MLRARLRATPLQRRIGLPAQPEVARHHRCRCLQTAVCALLRQSAAAIAETSLHNGACFRLVYFVMPAWWCRGHADDVTDVAWSPDGTGVASASIENTVIVWDVAKGKRKVRSPFLLTRTYFCSMRSYGGAALHVPV